MSLDMMSTQGKWFMWVVIILIVITLGIVIPMKLVPPYMVWARELKGKAELREAEWSRKVLIEEAAAKKESAKHLAEAEVIRAGGIAEANEIIGKSITEAYLKYKFIEGLNDGNTETIYVPTESNIPILEATRSLK